MRQSIRTQLRLISRRLDALDEHKPKQYRFATTREELDEIMKRKPINTVIISWRFPDDETAA